MIEDPNAESLTLRGGEKVTDAHLRTLAGLIQRKTASAGVGVRTRQLPWGTIYNYDGTGGSFEPPVFAPSTSKKGKLVRVRFARGLIAGIEPTINGVAISKPDPATGQLPFVEVPADFNDRGEAYVFFRLVFRQDWTYESIEAVVKKDVPKQLPHEAWKLALILFKRGTTWRALNSNQGHLAVARKANGDASHLFWSLM